MKNVKIQILDATPPKSKAQEIREICNSIRGKEQGVYVEFENDKCYFTKVALKYGFKTKTRIQTSGGWIIWVL